MAQPPFDPYSTVRMSVPHLPDLLARLRDPSIRRAVTIIHVQRAEEAEWIFANAASRLARNGIPVFGPEPATPNAVVEHAKVIRAKIVYVGELRREEDARAIRSAAAFGISAVGSIAAPSAERARNVLDALGPWVTYDLRLLA